MPCTDDESFDKLKLSPLSVAKTQYFCSKGKKERKKERQKATDNKVEQLYKFLIRIAEVILIAVRIEQS